MASRLGSAKPLSEPMLDFVNWTLRNKLQWNLNRNSDISIQENVFGNVWKKAASLFQPQCVNASLGEAGTYHYEVLCAVNASWEDFLWCHFDPNTRPSLCLCSEYFWQLLHIKMSEVFTQIKQHQKGQITKQTFSRNVSLPHKLQVMWSCPL